MGVLGLSKKQNPYSLFLLVLGASHIFSTVHALPVAPSGDVAQLPGTSNDDVAQTPRAPVGNDALPPAAPIGGNAQLPVAPIGDDTQLPVAPTGNAAQLPVASIGDAAQLPVAPKGNAAQPPVSPGGDTAQSSKAPKGEAAVPPVAPKIGVAKPPAGPNGDVAQPRAKVKEDDAWVKKLYEAIEGSPITDKDWAKRDTELAKDVILLTAGYFGTPEGQKMLQDVNVSDLDGASTGTGNDATSTGEGSTGAGAGVTDPAADSKETGQVSTKAGAGSTEASTKKGPGARESVEASTDIGVDSTSIDDQSSSSQTEPTTSRTAAAQSIKDPLQSDGETPATDNNILPPPNTPPQSGDGVTELDASTAQSDEMTPPPNAGAAQPVAGGGKAKRSVQAEQSARRPKYLSTRPTLSRRSAAPANAPADPGALGGGPDDQKLRQGLLDQVEESESIPKSRKARVFKALMLTFTPGPLIDQRKGDFGPGLRRIITAVRGFSAQKSVRFDVQKSEGIAARVGKWMNRRKEAKAAMKEAAKQNQELQILSGLNDLQVNVFQGRRNIFQRIFRSGKSAANKAPGKVSPPAAQSPQEGSPESPGTTPSELIPDDQSRRRTNEIMQEANEARLARQAANRQNRINNIPQGEAALRVEAAQAEAAARGKERTAQMFRTALTQEGTYLQSLPRSRRVTAAIKKNNLLIQAAEDSNVANDMAQKIWNDDVTSASAKARKTRFKNRLQTLAASDGQNEGAQIRDAQTDLTAAQNALESTSDAEQGETRSPQSNANARRQRARERKAALKQQRQQGQTSNEGTANEGSAAAGNPGSMNARTREAAKKQTSRQKKSKASNRRGGSSRGGRR